MGRGNNKIKRVIIKEYKYSLLLDSKEEIALRINIINNFDYDKYRALTPTVINYEDDKLIYTQKYYKKEKLDYYTKADFLEVASALDYFESIRFIHGDINKKNIIHTKDGFKIIDYEPSLYQVRNGLKQHMATIPYIANIDRELNKISILTDKVGFSYFVLRLMGKINTFDVVKISKTYDHQKYIGIEEKKLAQMSYSEILQVI